MQNFEPPSGILPKGGSGATDRDFILMSGVFSYDFLPFVDKSSTPWASSCYTIDYPASFPFEVLEFVSALRASPCFSVFALLDWSQRFLMDPLFE